jgi:hypothetical protein
MKRGACNMSKYTRYECSMQADRFRMKVNVTTNDHKEVQRLAKTQAASHLKQYHGLPVAMADMQIKSITAMGEVESDCDPAADKFMQSLGRGCI